MADKQIQPSKPAAVTPDVKKVDGKVESRKTFTRSGRTSGRKTSGFHGI